MTKPVSEAFIVVNPVTGKMRFFTSERNAFRQAFHFLFRLRYYDNPQRMTCENITWEVSRD